MIEVKHDRGSMNREGGHVVLAAQNAGGNGGSRSLGRASAIEALEGPGRARSGERSPRSEAARQGGAGRV